MNEREAGFWLGPWEGGWWLLPPVALVCGAWASGVTPLWRPELAALLALVLAGWRPFWRALSRTDWATPLRAWRTWEDEAPLPRIPYLQPGTPGAALQRRLQQALAWWRACGAQTLALPLRVALLSLGLSLLLALAIGRTALLLTFFFISLSEVALLWDERGHIPTFFHALMEAGLPWLLGSSLGAPDGLQLALALGLSLLVAAFLRPTRASGLGTLPLLGLLVSQHPFTAGWVALSCVPLVWLGMRAPDASTYRRRSAVWLMVVFILTAGALLWNG